MLEPRTLKFLAGLLVAYGSLVLPAYGGPAPLLAWLVAWGLAWLTSRRVARWSAPKQPPA